jgi:LmbE family N-acetylglucosaminyl deacetylase
MKKLFFWIFCFLLLPGFLCCYAEDISPLPEAQVALTADDRILILAPHPDDEALGCAGIIQSAVAQKIPLKIVFLTYGDNNEWSFLLYRKHPVFYPAAVRRMGEVRHDEAVAADKLLGVDEKSLVFLGYPDFRTIQIWYAHWGPGRDPETSMLTRAHSVPYKNAFRFGAPYKGEEILKDLETILSDFRPTKIFVSHAGDHNGDHQAFYLFLRVALWDLFPSINPEVYPYLVHMHGWPKPRGKFLDKRIEPPAIFRNKVFWREHELANDEVAQKFEAVRKHRSQYMSSPAYLASFVRLNEIFGDFSVLRMKPVDAGIALNQKPGVGEEKEVPEYLTGEEGDSFVTVEDDYVSQEKDSLVFSITISKPLVGNVGLSLFVFGYRKDAPFADMPKIQVRFGSLKYAAYDQDRKLPAGTVKVQRTSRKIVVTLPLSLLNNPERLLTSTHTTLDEVPMDWIAWRVVDIEKS